MSAREEQPNEAEVMVPWLSALIDADELDAAIACAEACGVTLAPGPMSKPYGVALARRGLVQRAITALTNAVSYSPADGESWVLLAEACLDAYAYDGAAHALDRACLLDPNAEEPAGKRARVLIARTKKQLTAG